MATSFRSTRTARTTVRAVAAMAVILLSDVAMADLGSQSWCTTVRVAEPSNERIEHKLYGFRDKRIGYHLEYVPADCAQGVCKGRIRSYATGRSIQVSLKAGIQTELEKSSFLRDKGAETPYFVLEVSEDLKSLRVVYAKKDRSMHEEWLPREYLGYHLTNRRSDAYKCMMGEQPPRP